MVWVAEQGKDATTLAGLLLLIVVVRSKLLNIRFKVQK